MGLRSWLRGAFAGPVMEAEPVAESLDAPTAKQVRRRGFEYGIPLVNATSSVQVAATSERLQILNQLHQLYMTCGWVSAAIDTVARTVTAGGLQIVADDDIPEGETPVEPGNVQRLRRLLRFTNPHEDMVQLLRCAAIDLQLFGDAYIEIVTVLGEPVALYTLDATTMTVISDQHGEVTGYRQDVDGVRTATFDPDQVIHISLDAPRGGLYGVGPAQKSLLPATAWLFTMATIKECFRRGDPPRLHVELGHYTDNDTQRWREQYTVNNLGPKAVGTPVITTGGGGVQVLDPRKVTDYLDAEKVLRDQIISCFGVPPSKLGIIETGNLGGGTGEAQDKALDLATPIPTPTGWTTMGELRVGDQVLDESGRPCNVIGTYEVPDAESWRLHFSDGTYIDCCSDHLWTTWTFQDRKAYGRSLSTDNNSLPENWPTWRSGRDHGPRTRRTADIIDTLRVKRGDANHSVPVTAPLDLPVADLPIDPYVLGAWLGDGTTVHGSITVGRGDEQTLDEIRAAGYTVNSRPSNPMSYGIIGLVTDLRRAGVLGNKHVPASYQRASAAQRLALLQGLMDTDGGFSSGQQVLFRSTNERLADAVVELARSLGQKPVKAKGRSMLNGVDHGPQFGVTWTPTIQVFRLKRKADKWAPNTGHGMSLLHRRIVDAEKIPDRPMRCIRVDSPNKLYLAGEAMIPTHNTFRVNTIIPLASLILEKLNYHMVQLGFGVEGWHLEFAEIDFRDSKTVEEIREIRLRNGAYTVNRWRDEIGEPPIDGGDSPIFVERQIVAVWDDIQRLSDATIANLTKQATPPGAEPAGKPGTRDPEDGLGLSKDAAQGEDPQGKAPRESVVDRDRRAVSESWQRAYRARRKQALRELPDVDKETAA